MRQRTLVVAGTVIAALVALYAVLGFLVAPRIARQMLIEHCQVEWQRHCAVASIHVNPFQLTAEIRGLEIPDRDGGRMLGLERAYADLEAASLWRRALVFAAVRLEAPYVRAVQRGDGSLNLRALAPKPEPRETDEPPPRLAVLDFSVARGRIDVRDERRPEPFEVALVPLEFQLRDFSTFAAGDRFHLAAGSDRAGRIDWRGSLETSPLASNGTLSLSGLPATTVSDLLGEALPLTMTAGRIDISLRYNFALEGQPFRLAVKDGRVGVTDLRLAGRGQTTTWHLGTVELEGGTLDVAQRQAAAARIVLREADTPLWFGREGLVLPGIQPAAHPPFTTVGEVPPADTPSTAGATLQADDPGSAQPGAAGDPGWVLQVPELRVEALRAHVEDRREAEPVPFDLRVPAFTVRHLAWPLTAPLEVDGRIESAAGGTLTAKGRTTLAPVTAKLEVGIEALDLTPLGTYIERGRALVFRSAVLSTQGRLRYEGARGLRYDGDATIRDLHTLDRAQGEDFLRLGALDVRGLAFDPAESGLAVREIVARKPFLRFVIGQDGITNVQDVLDPEGAARTRQAAREKREAASRRPAKRGRSGRRDQQEPPPPVTPPAAPLPFPARIERVRIERGTLNFADYTTLRPYFAAGIEDLQGRIDGLSSDPASRARVALEGKVDRYAPVTINGEVNYLSAQSYTDLAADFRNIELTTFTPYSGKFAGYRIDKGKLTAELNYHVENRRLDAKHRIVADQLELGDKVDSPDATKLPVKLVIALLRDRHGVIDLSVPVTGTLDDPKFRLGPVIWKVVLNLLTKIVTSPFALLGSLFGDGPDLSTVDFAPGEHALDDSAKSRLETLKKALFERPGLSLEIPAVAVQDRDLPALAAARYEALLSQAALGFAAKDGTVPGLDALRADPKRWRLLLVRAYTGLRGREPEIPKPPAPGPEGDATPPEPLAFGNDWLEAELRAAVTPDAEALRTLAQARAEAVREVLLADGQIDAGRVFLVVGEGTLAEDGRTRMTLKLQ